MKDLVLHFDFGYSYQNNVSVKEQLFDRLPASISVAIGAAVIWLVIRHRGRHHLRHPAAARCSTATTMGSALVAISAPVYWLGLVVALPVLRRHRASSRFLLQGRGQLRAVLRRTRRSGSSRCSCPGSCWRPSFAALYARLLRANLIEVMAEDYIRTARAKGLRERRVVLRHGLRSAITPIVTAAGLDIGILLGGTILVETVFNIPGVGRLAYDAIQNADLPMIQGTVLLGAFFIIIANLVVDVAYAFLDPRVRYS